jgi:hypothetical protein
MFAREVRGCREFSLSPLAAASTAGNAGTGAQIDPGTSAVTIHWGETATREAVNPRRATHGVPDPSLDAAASDRADSPRAVPYHPAHVWEVLTAFGRSCQNLERRAVERDEAAIVRRKPDVWWSVSPRRRTTP